MLDRSPASAYAFASEKNRGFRGALGRRSSACGCRFYCLPMAVVGHRPIQVMPSTAFNAASSQFHPSSTKALERSITPPRGDRPINTPLTARSV